MKRDNKGLTLIELVVTIAIIAIFSGVVLTFIGTTANSYRNTSSNAEAQMEVQQALDQIQDIVIDVNRGVYYQSIEGDALGNPSAVTGTGILNDIDQGDGQSKAFFVTSAVPREGTDDLYDFFCEIIQWDSVHKKIEYGVWTWEAKEPYFPEKENSDASGGQNVPSIGEGTQTAAPTTPDAKPVIDAKLKIDKTILAEDITGFEVDVSKTTKERIVRFQLMTNKRGKAIKTLHTVNIRNQIQISKPLINYETLRPGKPAILIINKPWSLKMNVNTEGFGAIHPNIKTITWKVKETDCATFANETSESPTICVTKYPKNGFVTVYVEGISYTGETLVSKEVIIPVEPEKKEYQLTLTDIKGNKSSEIYEDEKVELKVKLTENDVEIPVPSTVTWSCSRDEVPVEGVLTENGTNKTFTLPASNRIAGEYQVKVNYITPTGIVLTDTYTVIVNTVKAVIVFDENNSTTFFPGQERNFKLVLYNQKNQILQAEKIDWTLSASTDSSASTELGEVKPANADGFDGLYKAPVIEFKGETDLSVVIVNLKANYTLKGGKMGEVSVELLTTPLKMILTPNSPSLAIKLSEIKNEETPGGTAQNDNFVKNQIVAEVRDARDNNATNVAAQYDIAWEIDQKNSITKNIEAYSILPDQNGLAVFKVDKTKLQTNVDTIVINAIAYIKGTSKKVCAATTSIGVIVSKKEIFKKHYYCEPDGGMQELEYQQSSGEYMKTRVLGDTKGILLMQPQGQQIPKSVGIKNGANIGKNEGIIKIEVEFVDSVYHFYIHPVRRNVYPNIFNIFPQKKPLSFVPFTTTSIRDYAKLDSDGYTYVCKDTQGVQCQLRLSIHNETMVGSGISSWLSSSMDCWFMLREGKYYKYSRGKWHRAYEGIFPEDYWTLSKDAPTSNSGDKNTIYWKKWNKEESA